MLNLATSIASELSDLVQSMGITGGGGSSSSSAASSIDTHALARQLAEGKGGGFDLDLTTGAVTPSSSSSRQQNNNAPMGDPKRDSGSVEAKDTSSVDAQLHKAR